MVDAAWLETTLARHLKSAGFTVVAMERRKLPEYVCRQFESEVPDLEDRLRRTLYFWTHTKQGIFHLLVWCDLNGSNTHLVDLTGTGLPPERFDFSERFVFQTRSRFPCIEFTDYAMMYLHDLLVVQTDPARSDLSIKRRSPLPVDNGSEW